MLQGSRISGGIAVGRAIIVRAGHGGVARLPITRQKVEAECRRLREAARAASQKLARLSRLKGRSAAGEVSAILSAHALMAADPALLGAVEKMIRREHVNAAWALHEVAAQLRDRISAAGDPILSQRGEDVVQVAGAITAELSTETRHEGFDLSGEDQRGAILVADELSPAQAARLNPAQLAGIALERSGINSHAAIIARSFGLPAVVGVAGLLEASAKNRAIIVDGDRGIVEPRPTRDQLRRALEKRRRSLRREERRIARRTAQTHTADGTRVVLRANLELPQELPALARFGAEGIGLFRSEFLFLEDPASPPGVKRQHEVYEQLLLAAWPNDVVIRTYDLGGEKSLETARASAAALGLRGVRYSLAHPEMFREQLRALLHASASGSLRILLPMVSSPLEVREVRQHLSEVAGQENILQIPPLGVMVEVPSAVLLADSIAQVCDFFSIGTNDLAQYTLAADRADPDVAKYFRTLSPAVLRMIKLTVEAGERNHRPVALCGELAGNPVGAALLAGMGLRELSMSPVLLPRVQQFLAKFELSALERISARCLDCADAEEVAGVLAPLQRQMEKLD